MRVRTAHADDADRLQTFECSTDQWFEDEVEDHIRNYALSRSAAGEASYRLLLFEQDDELWAVGSHQPESLMLANPEAIEATRLVVLGVSLARQGGTLPDGRRYSDVALGGLIRDSLRRRRRAIITSLVALENMRSQRLCRRHGLTSETLSDASYVRMTGNFAIGA